MNDTRNMRPSEAVQNTDRTRESELSGTVCHATTSATSNHATTATSTINNQAELPEDCTPLHATDYHSSNDSYDSDDSQVEESDSEIEVD